MRWLLAIYLLCFGLMIADCATRPPGVPSDQCTGAEVCGTVGDCPALCATVARLGCSAQWGIDEGDGECLALCERADPGLCPRLASAQTTCAAIDAVSECQR